MVRAPLKYHGWKEEAEAWEWLNSGARLDGSTPDPRSDRAARSDSRSGKSDASVPTATARQEAWSPPGVLQPRGRRGRKYVMQVSDQSVWRGARRHWCAGGIQTAAVIETMDVAAGSTSSRKNPACNVGVRCVSAPPQELAGYPLDGDAVARNSEPEAVHPPALPAVARALLDMVRPTTPSMAGKQRRYLRPDTPQARFPQLPHELEAVGWRTLMSSPLGGAGTFSAMGPRKTGLLERPNGFLAESSPKEESSKPVDASKPWIPSRPRETESTFRRRRVVLHSDRKVRASRLQSQREKEPNNKQEIQTEQAPSGSVPMPRHSRTKLKSLKLSRSLSPTGSAEALNSNVVELIPSNQPLDILDSETDKAQALSEEEIQCARTSFLRYHKSHGPWPYNEMDIMSALADFGIVAYTHGERVVLRHALYSIAAAPDVTFEEFLTLIDSARKRMREVTSAALSHAFRSADTADRGWLDQTQALSFLTALGWSSERPGRKNDPVIEKQLDDILRETAAHKANCFTLDELELVVQRARECIVRRRRAREWDIIHDESMPEDLAAEFRPRIIDIYEAFQDLDSNNDDVLEANEIVVLLTDLGYVKNGPEATEFEDRLEKKQYLEQKEGFSFQDFLQQVSNMRLEQRRVRHHEIQDLFDRYDRNNNDVLEVHEICSIIYDFGLAPKSHCEQQSIAQLVEVADGDGSGSLSLHEFSVLMQWIGETLHFDRRAVENERSIREGVKPEEIHDFRNLFCNLDKRDVGFLTLVQVMPAVQFMKLDREGLRNAFRSADEDGSGDLDFPEFMVFMHFCEELRLQKQREEELEAKRAEQKQDEEGDSDGVEIEDPTQLKRLSNQSGRRHWLGENAEAKVKQALVL